jgi:Tol biopolymer transport system component
VSQDLLAYRTDLGTRTQLLWIDRNGEPAEAIKMPLDCRNPELSPDGRKVAVECYEGASRALRDIWIYDLERGAATRFTTHAADDSDPVWSPDGKQVAFTSNRNGPSDIFVKGAGGAGEEQLLAETPGATPLMAWSPNGQVLALYEIATQNLVAYDLTAKSITPILASPFLELEFQFSPNGRFFSYASDESGRNEIYVQPWPPNGEKWQISTNGGNDARWRRDGKEIYFVDTARDLIAASVDTTQDFKAGATTRLFNTRIAGPIGLGHRFPYAVSRDGSRFLVYVNEGTDVRPSITVVLNWLALLDR